MRIAYLVNQYPKVSHSFIRREIVALERHGAEVLRLAIRGWRDKLVDSEDALEQQRTRYVLQGGLPLLLSVIRVMVLSPGTFFSAAVLAVKMSRRADRNIFYHLIYLAEACKVLQWVRDFDADHLHAHFGSNSAEVAMLVKALGGPAYSFTVHGPEEFDKPELLKLREKAACAAFVVAVSSFGRSQLYRWLDHLHWNKVHVVHCGLEASFHELKPGVFPEARRLVCVGRLCEQKGQLLLVEAAHLLASKGIDFELVLAGDGDMRAEIESLIGRYGMEKKVSITGWISGDRVRQEILASRGLVLPSFAEGLPVVVMEAMALRRPVLTTYVAGIPELVIHGENGFLFPAGSIDELARAMERCLTSPVDILQAMGEAGRHRVVQRHSIDVEAGKLLNVFQSVQGQDA